MYKYKIVLYRYPYSGMEIEEKYLTFYFERHYEAFDEIYDIAKNILLGIDTDVRVWQAGIREIVLEKN